MGRYWAVLVDSYREIRDSSILGVCLAVAVASVAVTFCVGWWKYEEQNITLGERNGAPWIGLTAKNDDYGLKLTAIDRNGPARNLNLWNGCFLTAINGQSVSNKDELKALLKKAKGGDTWTLNVTKPWFNVLGFTLSEGGNFDFFMKTPTRYKIVILQWFVLQKYVVGMAGILIALVVTASFVPQFLQSGSIHLTLSRPVSRTGVIWAKFLGGLIFISILSTIFIGGMFLAVSLRSGIWIFRTLWSIPLLILAFAQFYAVSVFWSVLSKSEVLTIIMSVICYFLALTFNTSYGFVNGHIASFGPSAIVVSDDGRRVSFSWMTGQGMQIKQYNMSKNAAIGDFPTETDPRSMTNFQVSKDGQRFFCFVGGLLMEYDEAGRKSIREFDFQTSDASRFKVAPDEQTVAILTAYDLAVFDMNTRERFLWPNSSMQGFFRRRRRAGGHRIYTALDYDGVNVATGSREGKLRLLKRDNGLPVFTWDEAHKKPIRGLVLAGGCVISGSEDGRLKVFVPGQKEAVEVHADVGEVRGLVFNNKASLLAVRTEAAEVAVYRFKDKPTQGGKHLTYFKEVSGLGVPPNRLQFSANGGLLAIGGGNGLNTVWNTVTGERKELDLCARARQFHLGMDLVYYLIPRTKELDNISFYLLVGDDYKQVSEAMSGGEVEGEKVSYLMPVLSGFGFVLGMMLLTNLIFATRDL